MTDPNPPIKRKYSNVLICFINNSLGQSYRLKPKQLYPRRNPFGSLKERGGLVSERLSRRKKKRRRETAQKKVGVKESLIDDRLLDG